LTPIRKHLHQMIDDLPEEILINTYWSLNSIKKHQAILLRINNLPVYDIANPDHVKLIIKRRNKH